MSNNAPQTYYSVSCGNTVSGTASYSSRFFEETTTRCSMKCQMCIKQSMGSGLVDGDL